MLSGVSFKRRAPDSDDVVPEFVNQYILTDLYLSSISTPSLRKPILPSISTLVNPLSSLFAVCFAVFRAVFLVLLSRLPGSARTIKKISVSNTSIMYHDGRALATCESGPPLRVTLPDLDTMGWFDGNRAEGEPQTEEQTKAPVLGGDGLLSFMKEWTTAHPKVDPISNEMILFHATFAPPFVHYSILPTTQDPATTAVGRKLLNHPVAGVSSAKMMHDFGVSHDHTVILDLPLSLDPMQLAYNKPPIMYDCTHPSRFGVFPRYDSQSVRWFETAACCIFHTANTWDVYDDKGRLESVDMLACRMTSASVVFTAGNLDPPQLASTTIQDVVSLHQEKFSDYATFERGPSLEESPELARVSSLGERQPLIKSEDSLQFPYEDEQCRLYYYSFAMNSSKNDIKHQFALSAIPFEFPSVRPDREMQQARYVYGCSTIRGTFNSSLGKTAKVDGLVKFDALSLIGRAKEKPPPSVTGCVDDRTALEVVSAPHDPSDPIQIFQTPPGHFAQEPRFVPSASGEAEDDGFLITYMFDESQIGRDGEPMPSARSELWIIDAKSMRHVVARVQLPQRVPYGLHGSWFPEEQVLNQRPVQQIRQIADTDDSRIAALGRTVSDCLIRAIGG